MISWKIKKAIAPFHVNGMDGRILRLPAPASKRRQILLLYGHHASLERMAGIAEVLNKYGAVTMPDLPGFGGMDSFYKIGQKPHVDAYAEYLAAVMKLYYRRRRVTIVAMSFSVPLIVRTLQKHPDLAKRVDMVISIAGFLHRDDFIFSKHLYWSLRSLARLLSFRPAATFFKRFIFTKPVIAMTYWLGKNKHSKMKDAIDRKELERRINFEVGLWQMNDVRTRAYTMKEMFTLDLFQGEKLDIPFYHITASEDRYFDNNIVVQHMAIVFNKVELIPSNMANHAPTTVATAKEAAPYIPRRIRTLLS